MLKNHNPSTPEHLGGIHCMCLGHTLGYPKHLPSIQNHQAVGKWVRIWTNLLPLPCCGLCKVCGKSSCFTCGFWLARLHIFILTASVVGYITPAARLSKVLVGIRFAALNLYCLLLSRCCVSIYLSEKHSGCTAHFKPGILLSFLANIFSPMQPKLVATSSCQILVFWQQLMFAACIHKLLVAFFFRVFLVAMLRYTFSLMISHLLFLLFVWFPFFLVVSEPGSSSARSWWNSWWNLQPQQASTSTIEKQPSLPNRFSWGSNTWMITPKIEYSSYNNNNNNNIIIVIIGIEVPVSEEVYDITMIV